MPTSQSNKAGAGGAAQPTELRQRLTPQQWSCTQEGGTERPFANEFWDNKADGLYVDVVDGTPLFSSLDKYDSHSGWPSFTQPVDTAAMVVSTDTSHGMVRQEVRSSGAHSHLGHVFDDGPKPSGRRYCINSASLRFVPLQQLRHSGYEEHLFAFAAKMGWQETTLAGGCFWGVQEMLAEQPGVLATQVGYAGGKRREVTYESVCTGTTGHAEAVRVLFDPHKTSFERILHFFFEMHDPTTPNQQANDRGTQYRSAIFYSSPQQQQQAQKMVSALERSHHFAAPIVTDIVPLPFFVPAETYHQHYLDKHPQGYRCHVVKPFSWPQAANSL